MAHQISKIKEALLTRKQCKSGRQNEEWAGVQKRHRFLFELVVAKYISSGLAFLICETILCAPQLLKDLFNRDVFLRNHVQGCNFASQGVGVILI